MTIQYKHNDVFVFEPETYRLILEQKEIPLSQKEAAVLELLCKNAMKVVERKILLSEIWNERESSDISLNKSILLLRRKLESIGIHDAINTIPRVGYLLKIEIQSQDGASISHRPKIFEKDNEGISDIETEQENRVFWQNKPVIYKKIALGVAALLMVATLSVTTFWSYFRSKVEPHSEQLENDASHKHQEHFSFYHSLNTIPIKDSGQSFLYTNDINKLSRTSYESFSRMIRPGMKIYALATKKLISIVNYGLNDNEMWQLSFFIDNDISIDTQLKCIAQYVNNYTPRTKEINKVPGMYYADYEFFNPCLSETKKSYIGNLQVKTTIPRGDNRLTVIQDFKFTGRDRTLIYNLKRISRGYYITHELKHLIVKSLKVEFLDQEKLQKQPDAKRIFNEFTQDDITMVRVPNAPGVFINSPLGGIISHYRL